MGSVTCDSGTFCAACFSGYTNGDTQSVTLDGTTSVITIECGNTEAGVTMPYCSGYSRNDQLGNFCRTQCAQPSMTDSCNSAAQAYCNEYPGNQDCRCLHPKNTSYITGLTTVKYNDLVSYVSQNPLNVDPRCLYPACNPGSYYVLYDPSLSTVCPSATVYCTVSNVSVTLQDIVANNINVISQNCSSSSVAGSATKQGTHASGSSGLQIPATVKYYVCVGIVLFLLLVIIVVMWLVLRNKQSQVKRLAIEIQRNRGIELVSRSSAASSTTPGGQAGGATSSTPEAQASSSTSSPPPMQARSTAKVTPEASPIVTTAVMPEAASTNIAQPSMAVYPAQMV